MGRDQYSQTRRWMSARASNDQNIRQQPCVARQVRA
jgi:hypothetical protein